MSCLALDARLNSEYGREHLIDSKLWVCFPTSDLYSHPPRWRVTKELRGYKGKRHTPAPFPGSWLWVGFREEVLEMPSGPVVVPLARAVG